MLTIWFDRINQRILGVKMEGRWILPMPTVYEGPMTKKEILLCERPDRVRVILAASQLDESTLLDLCNEE